MKKSWGHSAQVRLSVVSQGSGPGSSSNPNDHSHSHSHIDDDAEDEHEIVNTHENENTCTTNTAERDEEEEDAALWTPVMIRGDPCGAFAAAKLLIPLLNTGPPDSIDDFDASSEMDDVVLDIPIHRSKHSAIIGKKGFTIANLSADHNVRIMVPHRNMEKISSASSNINIVQLEGELHNVERCLASMLKVVSSPPPAMNSSSPSGSHDASEQDASVPATGGPKKPKKPLKSKPKKTPSSEGVVTEPELDEEKGDDLHADSDTFGDGDNDRSAKSAEYQPRRSGRGRGRSGRGRGRSGKGRGRGRGGPARGDPASPKE